ncbi:hypothetical protein CBL_12332, partial [Carabus blaptoides fortunei]
MSLRRCRDIKKDLHFTSNDDYDPRTHSNPKLNKIWPIYQNLNEKCSNLYVPGRDISVDESLMLYKGRLGWKQYLPLKSAHFGFKLYHLCESKSGYVYSFLIYTEKGTILSDKYKNKSLTSQVVQSLAGNLLDQGYSITTDNFYLPPELADEMAGKEGYLLTINCAQSPDQGKFLKSATEQLAAQTDSKRPGGPRLGVASQAWLQDRMAPTKSTTAPSRNRDSISSEKAQVSDKSPNSSEKDNTVKPNMCVNADKDSPENATADQVLKECANLKRFVPSGSDSIRVDTRKKARESIDRISMGACEFRGIVKSLRSELRAKEHENFELLLRIAKLETSANESN